MRLHLFNSHWQFNNDISFFFIDRRVAKSSSKQHDKVDHPNALLVHCASVPCSFSRPTPTFKEISCKACLPLTKSHHLIYTRNCIWREMGPSCESPCRVTPTLATLKVNTRLNLRATKPVHPHCSSAYSFPFLSPLAPLCRAFITVVSINVLSICSIAFW